MKSIDNSNYYITLNGDVISPRGKKLKKFDNGKGYDCVHIYINKKRYSKKIYKLLATYYLKNPNKYKCVNHKNGNKKDNRLENLEWCSYSYNLKHAYANNFKKPAFLGKDGAKHPRSKPVVKVLNNEIISIYGSANKAARINNLSQQNISNVCRGKRNTCGGFNWRFFLNKDAILESNNKTFNSL